MHIGEMEIKIDPPQKITPWAVQAPRVSTSCCLVGPYDPGGFGVSGGWGSRRDQAYKYRFNRQLHFAEVIPITC